MPMGQEVATHLAGLGLGVLGTSLFVNVLPPAPDVCAAVFDSGGASPELGFGTVGIKYENPTAQIRFRGAPKDSNGPLLKARTAYKELAKVQASPVNGVLYLTLILLQPPFLLEREEGSERVVWAFNCLASKDPS
jgi:minor capsid protein